jgi:O-antigen/teichoic acid export membrane protein
MRGGATVLTAQALNFLILTVSTVTLARILTPSDFGLVAMVTAVTGLASAFADLGLSEATIQRKEITHHQISTLFSINVGIGLALSLLTASLAPLFVWFYRQPRLLLVTFCLAPTFLISGLRVQHDALLKRQMRFFALATRDTLAAVIGVSTAIFMALRGYGYWALIALPITSNLTLLAGSWMLAKWRPGLPRRDAGVRSMVSFGGSVAGSYLLISLVRSVDNVLVGWYWGAAPLGLYSRAYNLLMLPVKQLSGPAGNVAIPTFSRLQTDRERFARYYLRTINLIMWISAPVFGFLFVVATPVIVLVLGRQWRDAGPVFQLLVISAIAQLFLESTFWLLVSQGHSDRLFKLLMFISPIIVGGIAVGLPFGIRGVALSSSLTLLAILPWMLSYAFKGTELTLLRLGHALLCPILVCIFGVCLSQLGLALLVPERVITQILVAAVSFGVGLLISVCIPLVRKEVWSLRQLLIELRVPSSAVEAAQ